MVYLDSSALVKLLREEPESAALLRYLADHPQRASSALARVEVFRALRRANALPALHRRAELVLSSLALLPLDEPVLEEAAGLPPRNLRTLDALHLATALSLDGLDAFVTYDARLDAAAASAGLLVASPA